jgi:hypothetical protein
LRQQQIGIVDFLLADMWVFAIEVVVVSQCYIVGYRDFNFTLAS